MNSEKILLSHGSGGLLTGKLIEELILKYFDNPHLREMHDSALLKIDSKKICFTTDSYVINPIFFPGGDIGSLSVHGTVNDLAVSGALPLFISVSFIIEEGLLMSEFEKTCQSIASAAKEARVNVVTGDTKVVHKGKCDKIFINTSGVGIYNYKTLISPGSITPGDVIILNGNIAEHGAAILTKREELNVESDIKSDSAPLNNLIEKIKKVSSNIHCMRDCTRGGLGVVLLELAKQSRTNFFINETKIPIQENVKSICDILGLEPLYIANEGKFIVICNKNDANKILKEMKQDKYGKNASIIGEVKEEGSGRVFLKTTIGSEGLDLENSMILIILNIVSSNCLSLSLPSIE
jgi:hydrogenase expression/formation protein HypE